MDVSPCNSLFDLRFLALVPSRTLNGSSKGKTKIEELKGRRFAPAFLFWCARHGVQCIYTAWSNVVFDRVTWR